MTVEFYIHTELVNDVKERQATLAAARVLHEKYHSSPDLYVFIVNIDPDRDPAFAGLTQLDGVLLGPRFVTLLEFKNCFNPVTGADLDAPWYSHSNEGPEQLFAGKSINPFQQVSHARNVWMNYLRQTAVQVLKPHRLNHLRYAFEPGDAWSHLSACILFHPYLHPDSQIPPLKKAQLWCHVTGVNQLAALTYVIESNRLILSADERLNIARELFHARPWVDNQLGLHHLLGYLYVQDDERNVVRYPLRSYEEFIIGRSNLAASQGHRVNPQQTIVSSLHARLETDGNNVYLYDTGSKNGTFVNGRLLSPSIPIQLHNKQDVVSLGRPDGQACVFWFEPEKLLPVPPPPTAKTLLTGTFLGNQAQLGLPDMNE